jgi:hypothetical protein
MSALIPSRSRQAKEPVVAGYSGTPLAQKLGVKAGSTVYLAGAPPSYLQALAPLPSGVKFVGRLSAGVDIAHVFTTDRSALTKALSDFRKTLKPTTVIWVSWPKQASRMPTLVTENIVREVALPLGFVDVKVCAVDNIWSGLKLVVHKDLR